MHADFARETDSNFDGVVSGSLEEKEEDFQCDNFVGDSLVDEMGDEGGGRMTHDLRAQGQGLF